MQFSRKNLWLSFVSHRVHDLHIDKKRKWERVTKKGELGRSQRYRESGDNSIISDSRVEDRLRGRRSATSNATARSKKGMERVQVATG